MKTQVILMTLLWVTSTVLASRPVEAQQNKDVADVTATVQPSAAAPVSASQQTPDMVEEPPAGENPETVKSNRPPKVPEPMEPREKALFQAVYAGKLAEVQALVAKGAQVNFADGEQRTPLILAAYNGYTPIVEFLYEKGADVNAVDHDGMTALMYAAKRSFNETAAFLLSKGAEVNLRNRKKGLTALMLAAAWGNTELVQMLLDKGADPAIHDFFGVTAAGHAEKMSHTDVVKMLSAAQAQK
jgi:hypothetical protein